MSIEEYRRFYAEGIKLAANVRSDSLIEAFAHVSRENFLGPGPWKIATMGASPGRPIYVETQDADPRHLYHNLLVSLDSSRDLNNGEPAALPLSREWFRQPASPTPASTHASQRCDCSIQFVALLPQLPHERP